MESPFDESLSLLQKVAIEKVNSRNNDLFIKRDDLIDEFVSGNKWRKLKYSVEQAKNNYNDTLLTFGGAFSNHLLATAKAGAQFNLSTIGIVRGEELTTSSNEVLEKCQQYGMQLFFVSREEYGMRDDRIYLEQLLAKFPNTYIIPEGGANYLGMVGCQEILNGITESFDHVFVAQGTSTTSIGIAMSLPKNTLLHVVPVLKGFDSLSEMKLRMLSVGLDLEYCNEILSRVVVHSEAHFGGYGKYSDILLDGMEDFYMQTNVPLDHVYTGKVVMEILRWMDEMNIENQRILMVHTGGVFGGKHVQLKENRKYA